MFLCKFPNKLHKNEGGGGVCVCRDEIVMMMRIVMTRIMTLLPTRHNKFTPPKRKLDGVAPLVAKPSDAKGSHF